MLPTSQNRDVGSIATAFRRADSWCFVGIQGFLDSLALARNDSCGVGMIVVWVGRGHRRCRSSTCPEYLQTVLLLSGVRFRELSATFEAL